MRENTDQKNSEYGHFSRSELYSSKKIFIDKTEGITVWQEYAGHMKGPTSF